MGRRDGGEWGSATDERGGGVMAAHGVSWFCALRQVVGSVSLFTVRIEQNI